MKALRSAALWLLALPLPAQPLAIRDISVIPLSTPGTLTHQTVLVDGGRIVQIGAAAKVAVPPDAEVVDGAGLYLMPGLADMHVHLTSPEELPVYLSYGVTTVLNMRGAPEVLRWRDDVRSGRLLGPTIRTVGPTTDGDPPRNRRFVAVRSEADARALVRQQKAEGYDAIKVYDKYQAATYAALLDEAKRQDMAVLDHVAKEVGTERALELGQANVAHGEELFFTFFGGRPDEAKIPDLVRRFRDSGSSVTMNMAAKLETLAELDDLEALLGNEDGMALTAVAYHQWMRANNPHVSRPKLGEFREKNLTMYRFMLRLTAALHSGGIPILLGTDASWAGHHPGRSVHDELRAFVQAGLSPFEALTIAARAAGDFARTRLHEGEVFGVVAPGARADLVLLRRNPLEDIANASSVAAVVVRGRHLTGPELRQRIAAASASHAAERALVDRFDASIKSGRLADAKKAFAEMGTRRLLDLNVLVFDVLARAEHDAAGAVWIGEVATRLYPEEFASWNALGLACERALQPCAAEAYRRSADLQPFDALGQAGLARLERQRISGTGH